MTPPPVQVWLLIIEVLPSLPPSSLSIIPQNPWRVNIIRNVDMRKCGPKMLMNIWIRPGSQEILFLSFYYSDCSRRLKNEFKDLRKRPHICISCCFCIVQIKTCNPCLSCLCVRLTWGRNRNHCTCNIGSFSSLWQLRINSVGSGAHWGASCLSGTPYHLNQTLWGLGPRHQCF